MKSSWKPCARRQEAKPSLPLAWPGWSWGEFRRLAVEPRHTDGRKVPELTGREIEVLKLVATGMSYKQIGSHNRVELVRFVIAKGLDTPT